MFLIHVDNHFKFHFIMLGIIVLKNTGINKNTFDLSTYLEFPRDIRDDKILGCPMVHT